MTPYQLSLFVNDYSERKKAEQEEKLQFTYLCALWTSRFVWQKNVPTFEKLTKQTEKKQMTDDEMLKQVEFLNQLFGGEIKRVE
jgi:hypothetical protein